MAAKRVKTVELDNTALPLSPRSIKAHFDCGGQGPVRKPGAFPCNRSIVAKDTSIAMQYVVNSEPQRGECPFEQPHKARLCLPLSMEMRPCLLARYWTGWDRF
jgi:hypothetical protein